MLATDDKLRRRRRRLREARGQRGWTQFDLARRVGCSESQIAKIETGRIAPEPWLKEAIARELNITTLEVEL
jgi:ribosome-binding protein aMBF1 (putative translation factor)